MALVEMVMPKMGESIIEATILKWIKRKGDVVQKDESVLEVATDKVDTEVPSTYGGTLVEMLAKEGDVVAVGKPIALIETQQDAVEKPQPARIVQNQAVESNYKSETIISGSQSANRFYSPLVLNIARQENISFAELEQIGGTGKENRVTKNDLLNYLATRNSQTSGEAVNQASAFTEPNVSKPAIPTQAEHYENEPAVSYSGAHDIVVMDRMRKLIAERMLESKRISPHVTSFVEADVTNLSIWRNKVKHEFMEKEGDALTLTPLFIEALAKALKDFPMVNASVQGDRIIVKKDINIGMAVALPNGNLIVPVVKNADQYNIIGLTKKVNELVKRARSNKLTADDLADGTYTMSNIGSFGNVLGTPIIVQPQIAIMAFGAVQKKPAVIESPQGDTLGIRQMMFLSHSYDHRVVDGALGGMFVRKVADYLEKFDPSKKIY